MEEGLLLKMYRSAGVQAMPGRKVHGEADSAGLIYSHAILPIAMLLNKSPSTKQRQVLSAEVMAQEAQKLTVA